MQHIQDFVAFWETYPRRVGKIDAQKAYSKARTQASAAEILDGVTRYIAHKPRWMEWKHPGAWLRAGRWMDDYAPLSAPVTIDAGWFEECKVIHQGACEGDRMRHHIRLQIEKAS